MTEWIVSHEMKKNTSTQRRWLVGFLLVEVVSTKKTHHGKGCGLLASMRGSKNEKKTHRRKGCGWLTRGH